MAHVFSGLMAALMLPLSATPSTRPSSSSAPEPPPDLAAENAVILGFVQALHDSDWARAIGYCSPEVQEQARRYPSPEAFFRDVVPFEELTKKAKAEDYTLKYHPEGRKGGPWSRMALAFKLADLERDPAVPWALAMSTSVYWQARTQKADSRWVVDFQTTPLKAYIEKELAERRRVRAELTAKERALDPNLRGVHTRLTPLGMPFKVGEAMLFRLELVNDGPAELVYDDQQVGVNGSVSVKDKQGNPARYTGRPTQTWGTDKYIRAGQTVVLLDNWDLGSQYKLTKPGHYTVQFGGGISVAEADPKKSIEVYRPGSKTVETRPAPGRGTHRSFPSNIVKIEVGATQPASRPSE